MNIGRRKFLKFISSAFVGAQVESVANIVRTPEIYIDKELGFGFKIPIGWHLETFRDDFRELMGNQKLNGKYEGDEEVMSELTEGLMATLSKYSLIEDGTRKFSPSITFFTASDNTLNEYDSLLEMAHYSIKGFSEVLTDYECTQQPKYINRTDCVMVRSKSKFLYECENMTPTLIDNEMLLINHDSKIYTLHLYDSPYTNDTSQSEFSIFRKSLHLA